MPVHICRGLTIASVLFALSVSIGCSSSGKSKQPDGGPGIDPTQSAAIYPHAQNWKEASGHGVVTLNKGASVCLPCHPVDPSGTTPIVACHSCHIYPHSDAKTEHPKWIAAAGTGSCKTLCHGTDLAGGLSGVSCSKCHKGYPHEEGWKEAEEHGKSVRTNGIEGCLICHNNVTGNGNAKSCFDCHEGHKDIVAWRLPTGHGIRAANVAIREKCYTCHGPNGETLIKERNCKTCHSEGPTHERDWSTAVRHGVLAKTSAGRESCKICHGDDFRAVLNGKNCYSCHASFPHAGGWGLNHGANIPGGPDDCLRCHNGGLGTISPSSCFDCHDSAHGDLATWRTPAGHGTAAANPAAQANCFKCHVDRGTGLIRSKSCFTDCHALGIGHGEGWANASQHGVLANTAEKRTARCAVCHGNNFTVRLGPVGAQKNCFDCHRTVPHAPGWQEGAAHGADVSVNGTSGCLRCHNVGLGAISPVSCFSGNCHDAGHITLASWRTPAFHGMAAANPTAQTRCFKCHMNQGRELINGKSCYTGTCHTSGVGHNGAAWASNFGSIRPTPPSGHGLAAQSQTQRLARCAVCHGSNLRTVLGGKNCFTCHPKYPHLVEHYNVMPEVEDDTCRICHDGNSPAPSCEGSLCHPLE